jgi:ABC-2 type transport system ATP-binding protein
MDEVVKVVNVSKSFKLPHEKNVTIKSAFVNILKGKRNKTISTQHAIKDISFQINKGEFFGIVGRNGSGKSTLLKILAGIYQPSHGNVSVTGKLVPFIELGVGFNPEISGRENVYLNGALLGFSKKEVDNMYDNIVEFAELEEFMDQKLKNYSSGMQVRLAFSMAIRADADVLLVDEVLAVGDADFQRKCFDYFKRLKRENTTVIFVSHSMSAVREYCDRALLIDNSEIIFQGTAQDTAAEYSKLFNTSSSDKKPITGKENRWGNGDAQIKGPSLKVKKDESLEISFTVECKKSISDPILGYYFVNEQGQQICGTNTQMSGTKVSPFIEGESYAITINMANVLTDGTYHATLAVMGNSGADIADWWVDAVNISIVKSLHAPYVIDLPAEITIKHKP